MHFCFTGQYTPQSLNAILDNPTMNRYEVAKKLIEAAGGKLHGFYGMFGQEYGLAMIVEAPSHAEYIGAIIPAVAAGTFESYKTVPLYTAADVTKAIAVSKKVAEVYRPPMG